MLFDLPFRFGCAGWSTVLCIPNMSDPFESGGGQGNWATTGGLPQKFLPPNTQLGEGVPCGPNGAVMVGCSSNNTINQTIPGAIATTWTPPSCGFCPPSNPLTFTSFAPSLGPANAPFQKFTSTDNGDGARTHRVEFGFDQNFTSSFTGTIDNTFKMFFTVDAVTDSNGALVGMASGTWVLDIWEGTNTEGTLCTTPSTAKEAFGTFTADSGGLATCVDGWGQQCMGTNHPAFTAPVISGAFDGSGCLGPP